MHSKDTTLGGDERSFPATTLGFSGALRRDLAENPARALEAVAGRYWKPAYCYIRIAWGKSNEEAKDLTQSFFLWLLEKEVLRGYEPGRGGFRAYLKVLLRRFVGHADRDLGRQKRGGGARVFSLEGELPSLPELTSSRTLDPEKAFDQVWLSDQVERAISRVREQCRERGQTDRFRVYEAYALGPEAERPSYAELAGRFGISLGEAEKALFHIREELRSELRSALGQDGGSEKEVDDEWRRLLGG